MILSSSVSSVPSIPTVLPALSVPPSPFLPPNVVVVGDVCGPRRSASGAGFCGVCEWRWLGPFERPAAGSGGCGECEECGECGQFGECGVSR